PVVGVQYVIPEILERRAVKRIAAGARQNGDLCAGSAAKLWSEGRRLDTKLLHGIHGHQAVRSACSAERGERPSTGLDEGKVAGDPKIGTDAIYGEIVGIRALAIYAELPLVVKSCGGHDHTWGQHY